MNKLNSNQLKEMSLEERFWYYVGIQSKDECWNWRGSPSSIYGLFYLGNRRNTTAHRYSWQLFNGEIPDGLFVCHICDNPKCVNPNHLFLGTHQDNMDDKIRKNRQVRGSKHGNSKLTEDDVIEMLKLYNAGHTKISLSEMFGVSYALVKRITRRELWTHVNV